MGFFGGGKTRSILIIDDDVSLRTMMGMLFQENGWEVLESGSADYGIRLAYEKEPSVIILDIMLPQMSGFEAIGLLRSSPKTKDTPIIMCTARSGLDDVDQCLSAGANDYIQKPFELKAVLDKVAKYVK